MKNTKRKVKSYRKTFVALLIAVAVILSGCYNVLYEVFEKKGSGGGGFDDAVKTFRGGGELRFENVKDEKTGQLKTLIMPCAAQTIGANSNKSQGTVGVDAFEHSYKYRCPTLVVLPPNSTLPNGQKLGPYGRIVTSGDNRFGDTVYGGGGDLPQKTSSWSRFSDDNGATWSNVTYTAHFDDLDMSTFTQSNVFMGVTAADPTIGRTANNTLIVLSTFGPPMAGLHGGGHASGWAHFKGSDGKTYLRLRRNTEVYDFEQSTGLGTERFVRKTSPNVAWGAENSDTTDTNKWKYAVPVDGGEIVKYTNTGVQWDEVQKIEAGIGLYADEYYRVFKDRYFKEPYIVPQLERDGAHVNERKKQPGIKVCTAPEKTTQCHLFYIMSPYVAWRGCEYTGMSISKDGGVTWTPHKDITYMTRPKDYRNGYWFGSPCGGHLIENGKYSGRLIFTAYKGSGETTVAFWTEDNGTTWEHGKFFEGAATSETSIVDIPGSDDIIAVCRGSDEKAQYTVSKDGGATWETKKQLNLPYSCTSEMVSAANIRKSVSPSGAPLYAFSAGQDTGRRDGKIHVASVVPKNGSWEFDFNWAGPETTCTLYDGNMYVYSCIRELNDGNLMSLWETQDCNLSHCISYIYLDRE